MIYKNPVPNDTDMDGENLFESSSTDYIPMKSVYFAFIDVLGFKKTFEDIKISQNDANINNIREVFNYYFALMNAANFMRGRENSGCYAGQTSDSLYFYTDRRDFLLQFIKIFSHFNMYAMSRNIFFRGGIAKGSLYKKEKYQFYGDSVIGAYSIESNISKNPIIVVDEKTHSDLLYYDEYKDMFDDFNGRHYIKPFSFLGKDIKLEIADDFLVKTINEEAIKENIIKNLSDFEYDEKNYGKYVFLKKAMDSKK